MGPVTRFGRWLFEQVENLGRLFVVLFATLYWFIRPPYRIRETFRQMHRVGVGSFLIISLTGTFTGMVLALQTFYAFVTFNAESLVGATVALIMTRELGPVLSGLMVTARAGSAMAANLGTMRVTEQIDALRVMGADPIRQLVVPRFLGGVVAMPLLAAIFSMVGLLGAHMVGVSLLGVDVGSFWQQMQQSVETADINEGIVKSIVFGIAASLLAVWEGYNAIPTAEGVGRATTRTVVLTAIVVLIFDFMITAVAI